MAEFPNIGKQCSKEFCKQLDFLPFQCDGCGNTYCSDHKFADNHGCDKRYVQNATGEYDGVKSYGCDFAECGRRELMPVVCEQCQKNFCLSHRHQQDHRCEKMEVKIESTKTADHVKQLIASRPAKPPPKPKRGKSSKTAAKVALMKLKMKAVGDKGIPESDRVFLLVYLPVTTKERTKAMFFSKTWTIGRVIDSIASYNNITNPNNTKSPKKLRLFLQDCGALLETDQCLESFIQEDILYNGGTVIMESVSVDCAQLDNFSNYMF